MRTLVFDIGNTQIKMGVYDNKKLVASWQMMTAVKRTMDEYGLHMRSYLNYEGIAVESIDEIALASVVPGVTDSIVSAIRRYLNKEPMIIGPGIKTGFRIKTPNPQEVGADLIADVAAAIEKTEGPFIVVDFGTATKFEIVNREHEFIGAVFSPGIGICAEALAEKAAQLPSFAIQKPSTILTSTTIECMQAGVVYGYIGQVEYIVRLIKKEMKEPDMKVFATGGFGSLLVNELSCIDEFDPDLTLNGVLAIAANNRKRNQRGTKK